jgi:hypothetical protein
MVFAVGPLDRDEWPLALGIAYALARARERKRSDWLLASAENWSSLFGFRPLWRDDRTPDATIRRVNPSEGATDCLCFDSPRQLGPSSVLTFFFDFRLAVATFCPSRRSFLVFSRCAFGPSQFSHSRLLFTASNVCVF